MNRTLQVLLFLLLTGWMFTSCKSTRSALKQPIKQNDFNYLYTKMAENKVSFDFLSAKLAIDYYENRKKTNLRGQLRIQEDSLTWLSFSPALGIEAARVLLSNDSVKFINRLNKSYFTGKYEVLDSLLNTTIDYDILQAMIVGNDITQYDINKFKASIDGGYYRMTIQGRRKIKKELKSGVFDSKVLVQNIWLDPETFRIKRIDLKELGDDTKKLDVYYDKYVEHNDQLLPSIINIKISSQKTIFINVKVLRFELNKSLSFPFRIPAKYENLLE